MDENETIETTDEHVPVWRKPQSDLTAVDQMKLGVAGAAVGVGVVLTAHAVGEAYSRFSDWRWRRRMLKGIEEIDEVIDTTCEEQ